MTCKEFRVEYNLWLDGGQSSGLSPDAIIHMGGCAGCERYASAMRRIDAGLRNVPAVPFPEKLLAFPDTVREMNVDAARRAPLLPDIRRESAVALTVIAAWFLSSLLPAPSQAAVQFCLVTAGLFLFALASLRPHFLG